MANEEESFTAEVKTFMITKADDSTEKHEEKHECSRVIVQPCNNQNENDGCRMYKIVMYHHAKEVFSCKIHGNMHLAKQKNLVCWTVDSDKVFLELVDVTKIDDFQTTVNRLKTLTDQLIVVVPKEANNDHSGQSAMAVEVSHTLNVCTAQLKSDATQVTQHPTLENESVIADNSSCTNIDEKISNKSKNTIDEECPEASPQEESPRYTGNVQCSDHPSDCLEMASGEVASCSTIITTCRETDDSPQGEKMELEKPDKRDVREEYLEKMAKVYLQSAGELLMREREKNSKKFHRCISALICHQQGKSPHVAVLCTGTHYNDKQVCYSNESNCPCDGHAESLCYEAAPIYFQREMLECLDNKESIFTFNLEKQYFELKPDVTFHLLVTEPPCGWIRNKQPPKMQWKTTFKKAPHIPKCSSKILISSRMGIQGYLSHLLNDCIFVKSITLLCADIEVVKEWKLDYNYNDSKFSLPEISIMHYKPKLFNPITNQQTFLPMHLYEPKKPSINATPNMTKGMEQSDTHTNGIDDSGHKRSCLATGQSDPCSLYFKSTFNPCEKVEKKREIDYATFVKKGFSIVERQVDGKLLDKVNPDFQEERKKRMKIQYDELSDLLEVIDALRSLLKELKECEISQSIKLYIKACGEHSDVHKQIGFFDPEEYPIARMHKLHIDPEKHPIAKNIEIKMQQLLNKKFRYSKEVWDKEMEHFVKEIRDYQTEGTKLIDYQNMIKDVEKILEENSDIVIDCAWHRYFYNESTGVQKTAIKN